MINLLFPDFYTEAHQTLEKGEVLVELFKEHGINCLTDWDIPPKNYDGVFCGSFMKNQHLRSWMKGKHYPHLKVFHYSWDIYPWQLRGEESPYPYWKDWWQSYVDDLKVCTEVFIPSNSCTMRLEEFCNRAGRVVLAPVHTWDEPLWQGGYVLDCMRKYPDPNRNAVAESCKRLGIKCVETRNCLPWGEYKKSVAGCRFMVSAQYEASTGGLSLLEGYALGKPVLLSNSPLHGGNDYFGERGSYFKWDCPSSMDRLVEDMWDFTGRHPAWKPPDCREWVEETYNDARFVSEIATVIKEYLEVPR